MERKIVDTHHICLFCGQEMVKDYDEYTPFYECNCPDAQLERKIMEQVHALQMSMPEHKYSLDTAIVLRKIDE